MRIAIVNDVWSPDASTPEATLDRFTTLTGWSEAIAAQGATVAVFQRFHTDAALSRSIVAYRFVADGATPRPSAWFAGAGALHRGVAEYRPDVVHVNGFEFPRSLHRLRRSLPKSCAMVVQDHGGFDPERLSWPRRRWMRRGLAAADALLVATPPQVEAFRASGVAPARVRVLDVMEASTALRAASRRATVNGPALLWVGRLNANKDPLTVAAGFAQFLEEYPRATLTFVYQDADLEPQLRRMVDADERLRRSVVLRGLIPHERLADHYAAADFFVLGSHREGSGYSVLEALACGVPPIVTAIPSFRWITDHGAAGGLWKPGDPGSFCAALDRTMQRPIEALREHCRRRFEDRFSWTAIGRRAVEIYDELSRT